MEDSNSGLMQNFFNWSKHNKADLRYPQRPTAIVKRVCPPDPCTLGAGEYYQGPFTTSGVGVYPYGDTDIRISATLDVREAPTSKLGSDIGGGLRLFDQV